jgi:ferredoxin
VSEARPPERLRAVVDREACFGFGFCVDAVPAVFSLDGAGRSVAADVDVDAALLVQAVETCPRSAISLVRRQDPPGASSDVETGAGEGPSAGGIANSVA